VPDRARPGSRPASSAVSFADCSSSFVFASVIILEIDIEDVALIAVFEAKGQAPIAADRHREGPGRGPVSA
jgi:hypothetical protein